MTDIALPVEQTRAPDTIGASDAPAALGLDRYKPPIALWRQLRGLPVNEERPAFLEEAADWGRALEPVIRGKYAVSTGRMVAVPVESLIRDGWLRATSDGIVGPPDENGVGTYSIGSRPTEMWYPNEIAKGDIGLLQVKCRSAYRRDEYSDGVPGAEEVQCRVEMLVYDLPWNDCAILIGGNQYVVHRIERDEKLERNIERDLKLFWEMVQEGREPEVDGSDAWRRYASERMRPTPVVMDASEDDEALIANWITARNSRKKIEEAENEYKTKLLLRMSAAGATKIRSRFGVVPAYKVGGRTDWKGVAASLGVTQAPDKFKKPSNTWTLRCPVGDDED